MYITQIWHVSTLPDAQNVSHRHRTSYPASSLAPSSRIFSWGTRRYDTKHLLWFHWMIVTIRSWTRVCTQVRAFWLFPLGRQSSKNKIHVWSVWDSGMAIRLNPITAVWADIPWCFHAGIPLGQTVSLKGSTMNLLHARYVRSGTECMIKIPDYSILEHIG